MTWTPWSMPESSEGERVSPEWMKKVGPLARSALTTAASAGEAAAPVLLLHAVDVVGLDEGDGDGLGQRRGGEGQGGGESERAKRTVHGGLSRSVLGMLGSKH